MVPVWIVLFFVCLSRAIRSRLFPAGHAHRLLVWLGKGFQIRASCRLHLRRQLRRQLLLGPIESARDDVEEVRAEDRGR
jgi:hypothetical protein